MTSSLDGTVNFRDLGGTPLRDGGTIAPGVLFRSDALGGLTDAGLAALAASGIRVIVDFRTGPERAQLPNRLPAGTAFEILEEPILEGGLTGANRTGMPDPRTDPEGFAAMLEGLPPLPQLYEQMLEHSARAFATLARAVAAMPGNTTPATAPGGVLVHCTAGKDRTGVGVALLLDAIGARRENIVADYVRSESYLAGPWAEATLARLQTIGVAPTPAITSLVTDSPPEAMERVLQWLDARGGAEAYLLDGGLSPAELTRLRERLVQLD